MAGFKFLGTDTGRLPQVDRYELVAEIATGGMATVYLGRMLGLGGFERFVALKRLHPHLSSEQEFVNMFLDEARLVARIRHQHVVPVLEVGAGESGYYLVMEYIEGATLGQVLTQSLHAPERRLPGPVAVRIVLDLLLGLQAAHELQDANGELLGLVHRDVSPQNILIDMQGVSRIADFGVAHATSRLGSTRAGQLKGKVAYMAPEQARGESVTGRADLFSAAVVLWEALCFRRLFMAENEVSTLNRLFFEPIPRLRDYNPHVPSSIEKVLERALSRDAQARYATAADFAEALETSAKACRMLASANEVKAFMQAGFGADIDRQHEALRQHLARIDQGRSLITGPTAPSRLEVTAPAPASSLASVSSAAMAVPTTAPQPSAEQLPADLDLDPDVQAFAQRSSKRWPLWLGGALAALGIGGGLLLARSSSEGPVSAVAPVASSSQGEPAPVPASAEPASQAALDAAPSASAPEKRAPTSGGKEAAGKKLSATAEPVPSAPPVDDSTGQAPPVSDDLRRNPYR